MGRFINTKAISRMISGRRPVCGKSEAKESFQLETGNALRAGTEVFHSTATPERILFTVLLTVFALLLQEAVFNDLRILGCKPHLVLAVLLLTGMSCETDYSLILGLGAGLVTDICFGRYFGMYGLMYMYFTFLACLLIRPLLKGKALVYAAAAPVLIGADEIVLGVVSRFMSIYTSGGGRLFEDFPRHLLLRVLPRTAYTYGIFLILLFPFLGIWKRLGTVHHTKSTLFRTRNKKEGNG